MKSTILISASLLYVNWKAEVDREILRIRCHAKNVQNL